MLAMFSLSVASAAALRAPALDRRAVIRTGCAAAATSLPMVQQPAFAISATTMTGKTKPELGVILVDEVKSVGKTGVTGNLVLADGLVAAVKFDSAWPLAEGTHSLSTLLEGLKARLGPAATHSGTKWQAVTTIWSPSRAMAGIPRLFRSRSFPAAHL